MLIPVSEEVPEVAVPPIEVVGVVAVEAGKEFEVVVGFVRLVEGTAVVTGPVEAVVPVDRVELVETVGLPRPELNIVEDVSGLVGVVDVMEPTDVPVVAGSEGLAGSVGSGTTVPPTNVGAVDGRPATGVVGVRVVMGVRVTMGLVTPCEGPVCVRFCKGAERLPREPTS